jgi:hypothetical protein
VAELTFQTALAEIGQSPYYQAIVRRVQECAPIVPAYHYAGDSNIEEIKFKLAQREMHALVMSILAGGRRG